VADPHARIYNHRDLEAVHKYLAKYGKKDENLMMEDLSYRLDFLPKKQLITHVEESSKLKMHNHFEYNWVLGNKKAMFYLMR
jgi:hypothetical protein